MRSLSWTPGVGPCDFFPASFISFRDCSRHIFRRARMTFHLAQINIARLIAPLDDPKIAEFVAQLDPINALADRAPGFVWRLQSSSGNATDIAYNDDPFVIVNMSVWESIEALHDFAYRSNHAKVFRDRAKWFEKMDKPNYCL